MVETVCKVRSATFVAGIEGGPSVFQEHAGTATQHDSANAYCDGRFSFSTGIRLNRIAEVLQADPSEIRLRLEQSLGSTSADVLLQIQTYATARNAGAIERSTLVSIQAGANDFLDPENLMFLAAVPPGASDAADAIVNRIRQNLVRSVQAIKKVDKAQTIVWTVPDITLTPYAYFIGLEGAAAENVRLHIERLNHFIRGMGHRREIAVLDVSSVLTAAIIMPPVIAGVPLVPPPSPEGTLFITTRKKSRLFQ